LLPGWLPVLMSRSGVLGYYRGNRITAHSVLVLIRDSQCSCSSWIPDAGSTRRGVQEMSVAPSNIEQVIKTRPAAGKENRQNRPS
jgi:hypothetical protein